MSNNDFGLGEILAPLPICSFWDYYQIKPVIFKGNKNKYSDLLNWEKFNYYISQVGVQYERIRINKEGKEQEVKSHANIADKENQGSTIVFSSLHHFDEKLRSLVENVQLSLMEPCQANIYATPANNQGFAAHFDTHDVIIIQVSGEKHWKVYSNPKDFPIKSGKKTDSVPSEVAIDAILKNGDALYIPKGYWHEGFSNREQPSLHITLGIRSKSPLDFIKWLASYVENDSNFRETFRIKSENKKKFYSEVPKHVSVRIHDSFSKIFNEYKIDEYIKKYFIHKIQVDMITPELNIGLFIKTEDDAQYSLKHKKIGFIIQNEHETNLYCNGNNYSVAYPYSEIINELYINNGFVINAISSKFSLKIELVRKIVIKMLKDGILIKKA